MLLSLESQEPTTALNSGLIPLLDLGAPLRKGPAITPPPPKTRPSTHLEHLPRTLTV